jgi:cyclophilin family peptidyl-prolyl cis-trans isomerase
VFGRVVEGMDIVDQITQDDLILSVEVEVRD